MPKRSSSSETASQKDEPLLHENVTGTDVAHVEGCRIQSLYVLFDPAGA